MRTDRTGVTTTRPNSTAVEGRSTYRMAEPSDKPGRSTSTNVVSEQTRAVMTRRTAGTVEVRIGLVDVARPPRSTSA